MDTSFKAVILDSANRVLLGFNQRGEWELLGGRAESQDKTPEETIRREVREEAGLELEVFELIDIWYYDIPSGGRVAVASYRAGLAGGQQLTLGGEHDDVAFFDVKELDQLPLPNGYKESIRLAENARTKK